MKFAQLVLANFRRHRIRTALTILSIVVAFVLFGYLAAIRKAFEMGVSVAGANRLVVRHRVSIIQLLPQSYEARIEQVAGVASATPATWFGGYFKEPRNGFFPSMPVRIDEYLDTFPEFVVSKEHRENLRKTRTGALIGRKIADRYGWKVGDRVPITSPIWPAKSGSQLWTFDVAGVYDGGKKETDTTQFLFRFDYFEENRRWGDGFVGWYHIKVADPKQAEAIARRIDELFLNSPAETKTETEGAFIKGWAEQVGNIGAIVRIILTAVFFTLLLVVGNTMGQIVRERIGELGVLKAIGYSDGQVTALIVAESLIITTIGGALGLALAWLAIAAGDPTHGALPAFFFPPDDLAIGIAVVFILGLVAGSVPAVQAMRLNPADALRRE